MGGMSPRCRAAWEEQSGRRRTGVMVTWRVLCTSEERGRGTICCLPSLIRSSARALSAVGQKRKAEMVSTGTDSTWGAREVARS